MSLCGSCQAENDESDLFCYSCGASMPPRSSSSASGGVSTASLLNASAGRAPVRSSRSSGNFHLNLEKAADEWEKDPPRKSPRPGEGPRPRGAGRGKGATVAWCDKQEVLETMREVFHADSFSGWLLVGYQQDNCTLELQACGDGGITGCIDFLEDAQQQYIMLRIADPAKTVDASKPVTRDVLIIWQGPTVPILLRGKFAEHIKTVKEVLQPVHAELVCTGKKNLNDHTILARSDPLSGSHRIEN